MKAVILAAGKGTRMRELTNEVPKPMLRVQGKPILEHIVTGLISAGVHDIFIVTGWKAEAIEEFFGDGSKWNVRIAYGRQLVQDGTGKAPELAKNFIGDSSFILTYGDILVKPETYQQMVQRFQEGQFSGVITVTRGEDVTKGGLNFFDEQFCLSRLVEKPSSAQIEELRRTGWLKEGAPAWYNAGIYIFKPVIFVFTEKLQKSPRGEYELTDAISALIATKHVLAGLQIQGRWVDVRDPEVLASLENEPPQARRESLKDISRIVVKLGTGVLTDSRKQIDPEQLEQIVAQVAALRQAGKEVVLVTSGAVGAGMGALGYESRPGDLAEKQACAAVGQSRLMATYDKLFAKHNLVVAQVLLTHEDLEHHERHLNARNTLVTLLKFGVVPIINENDAVSFTEIKFGDNDMLSALVASLLPADLLVILTTVDGVIENFGKANPKTISIIQQIDSELEKIAGGTTSDTAVGGMASKIQAAKIVVRSGIPLVIASGKKKGVLGRVVAGEEEGTLFVSQAGRLQGRKRWIAFFHHPKGSLFVDDGAKKALREAGKSLLPPGVSRCEGDFATGDVVRLCDLDGTEFARGIAKFSANEIRSRTLTRVELVHRDDLVIL